MATVGKGGKMQNESVDERIQALHEFVALRFREQEVLLSQLLSGSRGKSGSSYKRDELITKAVTFEADELAQEDNNKEKATSPRSIEYARLGSARRSFVRQTMAVHSLKAEKVARMTRTRVSMHRMPPSEKVTGIRGNIREMISSTWFSVFITGLIALNVILLGIEVDVSASVLDVNDVPAWFGISNLVLVVMFVLEILLKVIGLGCLDFFCGPEWYWNMFDFFVVSISVADVVLDYVAQMLSSSLNTGHLRLMRSIRLARALRSMRVLRLFRYVTALRTLVLSIMSTMGSLFWTLALLIILFYSFGLVVTQLVVDHCRFITMDSGVGSLPTCPQLLDKYWASVSESMLTLFMAITGGVSYDDAMRPLREVGSLAVGFVVLYIAIAVIVVLNVVTGVFCSTAIESATADKDVATIKQVRTKNQQVDSLRGIFAEIDKSDSNEVSFQDVQDAISAGELSNFMEAMGISTDDVWSLCMLLDADKNGFIDLEEFVSGCMQLHGPAKSLQLAKMSFENKLTRQAIKNLSEDFAQFRELFLEDVAEQEDF